MLLESGVLCIESQCKVPFCVYLTANIVLTRYLHQKCVYSFGVDYPNSCAIRAETFYLNKRLNLVTLFYVIAVRVAKNKKKIEFVFTYFCLNIIDKMNREK